MCPSQSDLVYEAVKKDILTCKLPPGTMIAQPQLTERYAAGITPLREALQKLIKEGLVQSIPRSGYLITPITLVDVQELFELRIVVEMAVTRLAAERVTPAELEPLTQLAEITYINKDRDSYSDFLTRNTEFHLAVAAASKNQHMIKAVRQLLDSMTRIFHLGLDLQDNAEEIRAGHRALVAALRARDPDLAEQITKEQIIRSRQSVLKALLSQAGSSDLIHFRSSVQVVDNRHHK